MIPWIFLQSCNNFCQWCHIRVTGPFVMVFFFSCYLFSSSLLLFSCYFFFLFLFVLLLFFMFLFFPIFCYFFPVTFFPVTFFPVSFFRFFFPVTFFPTITWKDHRSLHGEGALPLRKRLLCIYPGPLFTKKTPPYRHRNPRYKPKTVWRQSHVYNENPYSDKTASC